MDVRVVGSFLVSCASLVLSGFRIIRLLEVFSSSVSFLFYRVNEFVSDEYHNWILWAPIGIGLGISIFFAFCFNLKENIDIIGSNDFLITCIFGAFISVFFHVLYKKHQIPLFTFFSKATLFIFIGFYTTYIKTANLSAPYTIFINQEKPVYIEGMIENIEHTASKTRLFQRVTIGEIHQNGLPSKAVINIKSDDIPLENGQRIRLKVFLTPIASQLFSGSFDPKFSAFLQGVGARGFSVSKIRVISSNDGAITSRISSLRNHITRTIHKNLAPPCGAIACALVTGDKAALPREVTQQFSDSGLSHILAISGLHLSIVSFICFAVFYRLLSLFPYVALRVNLYRISSIAALMVGLMYLQISGKNYPAQRACIMMFAAVFSTLISRRTDSLRTLAIAASFILAFDPFALMSISFQLSFAAVAALAAFYEHKANEVMHEETRNRPPKLIKHRQTGLASSLYVAYEKIRKFFSNSIHSTAVATVATVPFTMFYFHQISVQSILANIIAVPITVFLIAPIGILTMASMPFGIESALFPVWGKSIELLYKTAKISSENLSFLVWNVAPYPKMFLIISIAGGIFICLFKSRLRIFGIIVFIMGFSGIFFSYKPDFVIDPDHKVLAFIDYDRKKMLVSTKMSGRFAVAQWKRAFGAEHVQKFSKEDQATSEMFSVISTPKGFSILVCDELNEFYMKKYHTDFVIAKKTNFKTDDKRVLIIDQLPKNMGCMIFCDKNGFHLMFSGK